MYLVNVVITIIAAIVLLALAGMGLHRDRSRGGIFLCAALAVTALLELFDLLSLIVADGAIPWKRLSLFAEALLPPFWILCSLTYARQSGPWKIGRLTRVAVVLSFPFALLPAFFPFNSFFYAPDFPAERLLFLGNTGYFYYVGIMVFLVFALVNLEATLANASPAALRKIKFDIIGLGTIIAVLVFYYSHALLYRSISMNYLPLRSFLYLVATAMIVYSRIRRHGTVRVWVSRQAAYKSIVLISVGLYLLMLGLMGEGMQYVDATVQRSVTVSFAFLVGIALLALTLSERVRREVKVALHKNFYQQKHDYRTQWLRFTEQLATSRSGEELLQCILSAYSDIFGISGAALFLYEEAEGGYFVAATYEMQSTRDMVKPANSLIGFMGESRWVINIADENPEIHRDDRQVFTENGVSFVIPLFADERLEGFITLGPVIKADEVFIYEDYDLMKTMARQASLAIMHHRLSERATKTREMEAIGNVATFVVHDLKNLVSNISLIVENAPRHIHNPDFQQDMLASLENTTVKMQRLIGNLKNLGEGELFRPRQTNLLELVEKTAGMVTGYPVTVSGTPETAFVDENEIQKVILNLIINGIEASGPNESVLAEVGTAGAPFIRVTDQGCGMSARFIRTDLFTPFKTTKKQGLGIGLYQCRQIVEAHGGEIEVSSEEGGGSVFTVWLKDLEAPTPAVSCHETV